MITECGHCRRFNHSCDGDGNGSSAWPRYMIQVFKNEYEFAMEIKMGRSGKGIPVVRTEHAV